jgi:hypothetical protein
MDKVMAEAKKLMSMVDDEDELDLEAIKKKYQ